MDKCVDTYYFLGIGGIGMSALARYFVTQGMRVMGYDRVRSALTEQLEAEGIAIQYDERLDMVEQLDKERTVVVRTPAVPDEMEVHCWLMEHGFTIVKRAELLGELSREYKALCVAGTHGKTTTSTMLAHILRQSHVGTNAFLGGIANNYGSNLLLDKESDLMVVEADEFDRSFHHLTPYISVITSMDADHLDVYGTEEAYRESFAHYAGLVQEALVVHERVSGIGNRVSPQCKVYRYGVIGDEAKRREESLCPLGTSPMNKGGNLGEEAMDFYADNVRVKDGQIWFDFHVRGERIEAKGERLEARGEDIEDVQLGVPAMVNVENGVAAMAVAWLMGATEDELRDGMRSFTGVYRRFNVHVNTERVTYIDDYAHHPQELKATIDSVRRLYPHRYVIGVFQPHLYSRTRDFAGDFAEVLSGLDEVALLPIYPAREKPIAGVTSEWLMQLVGERKRKALVLPTVLPQYVRERVKNCLAKGQDVVVLTMGAGDIDRQVEQIKNKLINI